ncbi:hypothetical protein Syun_027231 [Stephania yunnanensis]|uniref:Uncharacterized protein n=1 Tax=Stephania yunnanensis TaxID=152371 RepID=A0AAP0EFA6_9MAGN
MPWWGCSLVGKGVIDVGEGVGKCVVGIVLDDDEDGTDDPDGMEGEGDAAAVSRSRDRAVGIDNADRERARDIGDDGDRRDETERPRDGETRDKKCDQVARPDGETETTANETAERRAPERPVARPDGRDETIERDGRRGRDDRPARRDGETDLGVGIFIFAWTLLDTWLYLMNAAGWIPREQILGAEPLSKVPEEFVPQHPSNGNPPTLFLILHGKILFVEPKGISFQLVKIAKSYHSWIEHLFVLKHGSNGSIPLKQDLNEEANRAFPDDKLLTKDGKPKYFKAFHISWLPKLCSVQGSAISSNLKALFPAWYFAFTYFTTDCIGILTDQNKLVVAVRGATALTAGVYTTRSETECKKSVSDSVANQKRNQRRNS